MYVSILSQSIGENQNHYQQTFNDVHVLLDPVGILEMVILDSTWL